MSEGEFTHVTPHRPDKRPPRRRREHRYLGHGRVAARARPEPQRPRRHLRDLVRRVLHGGRDHRHPPGDQGGVAPGAGRRSLPRRRLVSTAGRSCSPTPSTRRTAYQPQSGPTRPPKVDVPFDWGTEDGYEFFLRAGPLGNLTARLGAPNPTWHELLEHSTYDEFWQSRAIWRHLQNIRCPVLVGRWLVRRRGPVGTAARLSRHQGREPRHRRRRLVMGPWTHGGWAVDDGRRLGSVDFATDTAAFYREHILLPFFEHHLKDAPDPELPGALVFETGTNVWRRYADVAGPRARRRGRCTSASTAGCRSSRRRTRTPATRTSAIPAKPVPWRRLHGADDARGVHGLGPALRGDPARRARLRRPSRSRRTWRSPVRCHRSCSSRRPGTDSDWVVKLIDVYPPDRSTPAAARRGPRRDVGAAGARSRATSSSSAAGRSAGKFRTQLRDTPSRSSRARSRRWPSRCPT